ncbi:MAG: hypothetical protein Q9219_001624 [cf. Caloplaca sp. 3 TL-2023]
MAAALHDAPVLTRPATGHFTTTRPPCPRIPIVPAIPRKLEKKVQKSSSMVAGSYSAPTTTPERPVSYIALNQGKDSEDGRMDYEPHKSNSTFEDQTMKFTRSTTDATATQEDGTLESAGAFPGKTAEVETPSQVANSATPSALDPHTPPFIPEASRTSQDTADNPSEATGGNDSPSAKGTQQIPNDLQTAASWMPYNNTPPEDVLASPIPSLYPDYRQPDSLPYAHTATYAQPGGNSTVYYGHGHLHNISFYPQSSHSYQSASSAHSAYEGYAIANSPQTYYPRNDGPSYHQYAPSTTSRLSNPSMFPLYQPQTQYPRNMPQFGSQMPITPSATPSNSGSQNQESFQTKVDSLNSTTDEVEAAESKQLGTSSKEISQDYEEWYNRTLRTLKEDPDPSTRSHTLLNHIIDNFNNPIFADCELYISHVNHRFEPAVLSLHSLLIAQNAKLLELVQSAEMREDGKKQILLAVKDQYTTPDALKNAVKVCYGEKPSHYIGQPLDLGSESEISIDWMKNALAIAAAGHLLGMTGMAHRGEQIASIVLDWHNLELALSFAMDTNICRAWGSSTNSTNFPCNASELLLSCLYFIVSNTSQSIKLDTTAKCVASINRLPAVPDSEAQSSILRLSQIRFGDLPIKHEEVTDEHDILISRILLSLPFAHLKFVLDRLPLNVNRKIAEALIGERERRRLHAVHASTNTQTETEGETLLTSIKEERIMKTDEGKGRFGVETVGA